MKNLTEVCRALQILKDNAESDFELHRIEVLEQDLKAPPHVEIVDDKRIIFNNMKFRKIKNGKYKTDEFLHRCLYQYFVGEIPAGFEIHHIDNNPENNSLENLLCLTKSEHTRLHFESSTGRFSKAEMTCQMCGKTFQKRYNGHNRFCSDKCKNKARHIEDREVRICAYCGNPFETEHSSKVTHCSVSCAQKDRHRDSWEDLICPVCGKKFSAKKQFHQQYCSQICARKFLSSERREIRYCAYCGKPFNCLKSKLKKFCSRACFQSSVKKNSCSTSTA